MAALIGTFVLALLMLGPRRVLRDWRVGVAVAIAIAGLLPYVGWEAAHGWPSVTFLPSQDAATAASVSRPGYVAQQVNAAWRRMQLTPWGQHRVRNAVS